MKIINTHLLETYKKDTILQPLRDESTPSLLRFTNDPEVLRLLVSVAVDDDSVSTTWDSDRKEVVVGKVSIKK